MTNSIRLALLLGLQLAAGAAFTGCGSDSDPEMDAPANPGGGGAKDPAGQAGTLQILNAPLYSAFVEGHEATLPVTVKGVKGAKFSSSDTSVAIVTDTADGATITIKKDGSTTITAKTDDDSGSAKLTVTKFTEAQWTLGEARYSKAELAIVPAPGEAVSLLALANPAAKRDAAGACNTCHTAQAKTLKIENTPTQIAGYSDQDLITIFTKGMKPPAAEMKSRIPPIAWGMFHAWEVTEEEKAGLIAYLRTQPPKANPAMIDYGVTLCPGAPPPMLGDTMIMLCDNNGKPVSIPGLPGAGGGTPSTGGADAGSGTSTSTADAGAPAADGG